MARKKDESEEKREDGLRESGEETEAGAPVFGEQPRGSAEPTEEDTLRLRVEELNDRWLRAVADLDNFRKRTAREREKERGLIRAAVILPLLDVLDDLERALAKGKGAGPEDFRSGIEMIHRKFLGALGEQGVLPIASLDRPFDPELHEAFQAVPDPSGEEGRVVAEIRRGYRIGDHVIRPSQVAVSAPPAGDGSEEAPKKTFDEPKHKENEEEPDNG
ncbi:MAG: nucleotide exchange factor GrpE [Candidatus Eisenbacteria bacterium]|nr:nucleotide exchange factor GrpE [Candidatus Eisenbacteria bacterium]